MIIGRAPLPLLTREVRPLDLRSGNTCLLLQDLHAPFADAEQGWLYRRAREKVLLREFDEYYGALERVLPNVERLLRAVRELGLPVAYSCLGYRPPDPPSAFQAATGWTWNLDGPDGAFAPALQPRPGEPVFARPAWGALANPDFGRFLDRHGIVNVIIAGTMLDFGIQHTCYELMDRGAGSLVVSDGAAALLHEGQGYTARNIAHGLTKLRNTAELLDLLAVLQQEGSVLI